MRVIATYITGHVPLLPWWRALSTTPSEIEVYNDRFLRRETVEFDADDDFLQPERVSNE